MRELQNEAVKRDLLLRPRSHWLRSSLSIYYKTLVGQGGWSHSRHFAVRPLPEMDVAPQMYLLCIYKLCSVSVVIYGRKAF
jgi:hypothetical protein